MKSLSRSRLTLAKYTPYNLITMKTINVIAICICALLLSSCSRSSSGSYTGNCQNQTYGGSAEMALILNDDHGSLTGSLTLSGDLGGGGEIHGRRDGEIISFVTRSPYGQITWSGTIKESTIEGPYIIESSPEYVTATGLTASQRGIWKVTRR